MPPVELANPNKAVSDCRPLLLGPIQGESEQGTQGNPDAQEGGLSGDQAKARPGRDTDAHPDRNVTLRLLRPGAF